MQREELEKWIGTQATRKRPLEDFSTGGRCKKLRVKIAPSGLQVDHDHLARQKSLCQPSFTKANSRLKRSRSEGDLEFDRENSRLKTESILPTFPDDLKSDLETSDTLEMEKNTQDIAPPSPTSFQAFAMTPPLHSSSRASSRARSNSSTISKKVNVTSSSYRTEVLQLNQVFVGYCDTLKDILDTVSRIIHRERSSPELTDEESTRIARVACNLVNKDKQNIITALVPELFPQPQSTGPYSTLKCNEKLPLNSGAVPGVRQPEGLPPLWPAIPKPNPDIIYGYSLNAFTDKQQLAQRLADKRTTCVLSKTSKDLYWGFFVLECKSQVNGGTIWVAINQCAGGGSTCVNAASQLFRLAMGEESRRTDSISFLLAIDGQTASLYVHWHEEAKGFYLDPVKVYVLTEAEDIKKLKCHAKNVAEWGLGSRLDATEIALDNFIGKELENVQSARKRTFGSYSVASDG